MSNWLKLEGDVCAVTGALGGMGVAICREFARNGANVVLLDLDEENLPEEPFSLERKPDPYMLRLNNGMRAKPLPDVSEYAAKARELESAENENL